MRKARDLTPSRIRRIERRAVDLEPSVRLELLVDPLDADDHLRRLRARRYRERTTETGPRSPQALNRALNFGTRGKGRKGPAQATHEPVRHLR
jgi:hypothetical protein